MAQGAGYWYNPDNNVGVEINRHEHDIKIPKIQEALDLHWAAQEALEDLPVNAKNEEEIKRLAVESGQVRIRDWQNFVTIQLSARKRKLQEALGAIADLIQAFKDKGKTFNKLTPDTKSLAKLLATSWTLKVDNLATKSSQSIDPDEYLKSYADEGFLEDENWDGSNRPIYDISFNDELTIKVQDKLRKHGYYKDVDIQNLFEDTSVNYSIEKNKRALNEEKLSRVWQMANQKGFVWGIITGYRGENDEKTNEAINRKLKRDIRKQGYGFWELDGRWVETDEGGNKQDIGERSLFVAAPKGTDGNDFLRFMIDMTQKYDQDASVYKNDPEPESPVMLYQYKNEKDGDRVVDEDHFPIGKFNANKIADNYSKILGNGRTFVFESVSDSFLIKDFLDVNGKLIATMTEDEIRGSIGSMRGKHCATWAGAVSRDTKVRGLEDALKSLEESR